MIHKIKALHDNGKGLSIRAISQELGLSRNTVRKYLRMDENAISEQIEDPSRTKRLDDHRDYLIHLLKEFPKLSAVKVARKLQAKVGDLPASDRSIRRYVRTLKEEVASAQIRYYEPILDDMPGVQCQVDPGELRGVLIGGEERTLHFVVFVLSYSRLMYVGLSFRPLDTQTFIQLHDEALRYFGGLPEECVYDQTKLVVINEQYRELTLNQRFHEYATTAGFRIHACEGYDPESKGKVEAGVKYVKQDCLYGEVFRDPEHVRQHVQDWVESVANVRLHGTTGERPRERFERDEREHLEAYLSPACVQPVAHETRRADKTGLIAWKANKYSVPMPGNRPGWAFWSPAVSSILATWKQAMSLPVTLCVPTRERCSRTPITTGIMPSGWPPLRARSTTWSAMKSGIGCANSSSVPSPRSTRISWWLPVTCSSAMRLWIRR